jgi:hypothetical protein
MKNVMTETLNEVNKEKPLVFQVLLLNNDGNQVEVQEADSVDFVIVQRHLKRGGSVFITSKNKQKLAVPKEKQPQTAKSIGWVTAFYSNHA